MAQCKLVSVNRFLTFVTVAALAYPAALCAADGATLALRSLPHPLTVRNTAIRAEVTNGGALRMAAKGGTNLFINPAGGYQVVDAPMALFTPDVNFVLTAKVSVDLRNVYDVAALVVYDREDWWAKLCFENSVDKVPTAVSVVTREYSDDANSITVSSGSAWLAILRRGDEFAFHVSSDGKSWHLIRHFRMKLSAGAKAGFAVHGSRGDFVEAAFSDVTYSTTPPASLRQFSPAR